MREGPLRGVVDLSSGLTVRSYQDDDEPKLLALLQAAFGSWPRLDVAVPPVEHLRWKLRSSDASLGLHTIAEADSQMIGAWLVDIQEFKVGARILTCRRGMDTCVHPDHRSAGVMTKMRALTRDSFNGAVDFRLGGQTRHSGQLRLVKREPYEMLGNSIQVLRCPLTVRSVFSDVKLRKGGPPRRIVAAIAALAHRPLNRSPAEHEAGRSWTVREQDSFDDRIDDLWEQASSSFDVIAVRKKGRLNWRYADARAGAFQIELAEEAGRVLGYIVLRAMRRKGYIADLLALPGRLDVVASLVREGLAYCGGMRAEKVECWLPALHPYRDTLRRLGFQFSKPRRPPFIYGPLRVPAEALDILRRPSTSVHFMIGDSEGV